MVYYDVSSEHVLGVLAHLFLNVTWWVGGQAADRFGETAGRVATATVAVYAAFTTVILRLLVLGVVARITWRYVASLVVIGWESQAAKPVATLPLPSPLVSSPPFQSPP